MTDANGTPARVLVDRWVVLGIGALSVLGGIIFLIMGVHAIAIYLFAAGVAFLLSSLAWRQRYQNILGQVPEGYLPTGEVYENPGGDGPVAVYFKGIRRVYVRADR